jgi:tetratricopeptide (TPR) repeat protein
MAKKQRRRTRRSRSAPTTLSPEAKESKAQEDLSRARYREAIAGFKELLKLEPRPAWRAGLADAYAGRAHELATKGMLKEALVMWENRAGLGEGIAFDPDHAALLLQMDRVEPVLALFTGKNAMPPADLERLRPHLAARFLADDDRLGERLPADEPVVVHAQIARTALGAYCAGDDARLQAALTAIPFRSPYRDWVQILKALQRLPASPEEAAGLLARVGEDSPFRNLRRAAQLALLPATAFLAAIPSAGRKAVRFACALRGWSEARIGLWEDLNRLGSSPPPQTLLQFMQRHREALGADWVRRRCLSLLVEGFPSSLKRLRAIGASPASAEESHLIAAWSAEHGGDPWDQQQRWQTYARHLMRDRAPHGRDEGNRRLRIALALRRCEQTNGILSRHAPSEDPEDLDRLVADQLEESLVWDPDDRDTYLRLIGYYRRGKRLKDVRRLLDQAFERWPRDMQVLGAALDAALDAGSFKKAAGLAREMLALDPINSGVRERLVEAHLNHARKQAIQGRPDLARKELARAEEWARSEHVHDRIDLASGLLALVENPETGASVLRGIADRLGGGLAARLALALAGEAHKLSPGDLFKAVGLGKPPAPVRDDLLATLSRLRTHLDGGGKISRELNTYLAKPLSAAAWTGLTQGETEAACDTLRRCGLNQVRRRVARAGLKRWKGAPVFELHAFEAKYPRGYGACSHNDLFRLEEAMDRAREEGDARIALRIEEILASLGPFAIGPAPYGPPPLPATDPFIPDAEMLAALIELQGLNKALDLLGVPPDMKRDLKAMERRLGIEAVAQILVSSLETTDGITEPDTAPPIPRPPRRRAAVLKGGRPASRPADDHDQDDEFPDQMDLF